MIIEESADTTFEQAMLATRAPISVVESAFHMLAVSGDDNPILDDVIGLINDMESGELTQ